MIPPLHAQTETRQFKASVKRAGRKVKSWERLQRWAAKKRGAKFKIGGRKAR